MNTLTYLFWSLKKYYERAWLIKGQYNWTILAFSLPYNFPILIFSGVFSKEYIKPFLELRIKNEFWEILITILLPLIVFLLLTQPLKFFFPKKKIENLVYTRKEIKRYQLNILYFLCSLIVLIVIIFLYVKSKK